VDAVLGGHKLFAEHHCNQFLHPLTLLTIRQMECLGSQQSRFRQLSIRQIVLLTIA